MLKCGSSYQTAGEFYKIPKELGAHWSQEIYSSHVGRHWVRQPRPASTPVVLTNGALKITEIAHWGHKCTLLPSPLPLQGLLVLLQSFGWLMGLWLGALWSLMGLVQALVILEPLHPTAGRSWQVLQRCKEALLKGRAVVFGKASALQTSPPLLWADVCLCRVRSVAVWGSSAKRRGFEGTQTHVQTGRHSQQLLQSHQMRASLNCKCLFDVTVYTQSSICTYICIYYILQHL